MSMENDKELREKFSKILGAPFLKKGAYDYETKQTLYSWEEIFNEIGKLQERASRPPEIVKEYWPNTNPMPFGSPNTANPNLHYHNGTPCYQNPCSWC